MKMKTTISGALLRGARRDSGSALLTAILFAFVIGALSVTYLRMASFEHRSAMRSSLYASSLNLAESGVEMAIAQLNAGSVSGSRSTGESLGFLSDAGFTGDVQYVILSASSRSPDIYAEGQIHSANMDVVKKQVKVGLSSGFQPFEKGFSARDGISFSGNGVILDSYNSNYGPYDEDLPSTYIDSNGDIQEVPSTYGVRGKNKNDDIYVASALLVDSGGVSVSVGNADIYGYVSVGPGSRVSVNAQGMVTTYEDSEDGLAGEHQESRVQGDFYADFPVTEAPSASYSNYRFARGRVDNHVIVGSDDPDNPTYYNVPGFSMTGQDNLTITGNVVIVMEGDIHVGTGITLAEGASAEIYTDYDVTVRGNGIVNEGSPSDFEIFGTAEMDGEDAGQSMDISGNGNLSASVYAPNGDVSLNGGGNNGNVYGGVVALTAVVTGGSAFHFDEALREIVEGDGSYQVSSWLEMTGETPESSPIDMASYFD